MTLSSVVLPLPLGPTSMVSSPKRMVRWMPRRAWTCVSPRPKTLVTLRQLTARHSPATRLSPEHDCGLEHQHAAYADEAGQADDTQHDQANRRHHLPGENDSACRQ